MMLADMGCVVSHEASFPPPSKFPRPYARFRAAGAAVRAVFRFQYMCRRKREYLQSKSEKLDPAGRSAASTSPILVSSSLPKVTFSAPLASELGQSISRSSSTGIGRVMGIPTVLSNTGIRAMSGAHSGTKMVPGRHSLAKGHDHADSAKHSVTGPAKHSPPKPHQHTSVPHLRSKIPRNPSHSTAGSQGGSVKKSVSSASAGKEGVGLRSPSMSQAYSPQILEYMEGLERYQSRLSKTKPSSPRTAQ